MSNTVKLPTCPKCGIPIPKEAPQGLCPKCVLLGAATATEQGVPATATSEIPSIERISKAFPQLEILELIGRGGMGFVFKARQPHLDRFVALKLLPDKLAKDPQFAERFNREGRVLAKLNHPNIVSVFDFGQTGGFYYLTMEYVDGVNLRQAMRAGRFSPAEALSIVPKVCEALQYAHEQGILHRDIKPENILLDAKGRVKIADFGIAKLVGEDQPNITLTNTGAALGTPHYMAPEQLEKPATVDHRADIYSLGVVFYEMLTGELPIGRFAAPSAKTPVNTTVDDVVFRTLEKDRERRFQSAGEMKTQVEHLGAGSLEQPEAGEDADDEAPRSWLEAVYSMRLVGWFLAAFCLVNFAFPHVTRLGNSPADTYSLGFSRPWLVSVPLVDEHNVVTREWRFNPSTTSFGTGMFGLALVAALLVLRHRVRTAPAVPRSEGRISNWSLYGAIAVGLSLPAPMTILVALLTGMGGVGPGELWLALGSVALPGLGGTLLGWLALNEIRESRGRVKGLPLAMFATLFWPLTILGALTIGVPMFLSVPGGEPSVARTFGRFLVLLLPAAVIAFGFWTIHATARWASQQQVPQQRGVLKWVFIVVLVVGMGVVLVTQPGKRDGVKPAPQMFVSGTPVEQQESDSPASLRANFRFAKGHVVTFQVMRRVGDDAYEPVPNFAGYAVAPDDERGRFSLMLVPLPDSASSSTNLRTWRIRLESEGGGSAGGPSAPLGELISMLPTNHFHEMESDASFGLYLTRAYPGAETNGITPLAELSLDVRSVPRGKVGVGPENTLLRLGSTNWVPSLKQLAKAKPAPRAQPGEVLAYQWLKSPVGTNTTNWIRFTFTNVELRNEDGQQWLAMGYLTDVRGDCEEVFVVNGNGFKPVTRKTSWRSSPAGSPPIDYSGIQWLVPPGIDAATLESFRNSVAEALVAKSFVIPEGEQRPLIRFPIGKVGDLSVGIGAKLKLKMEPVEPGLVPPNPADASAERWSPKLVLGEKPNVSEILQEAKRLTDAGRFEEALQRYIWYHKHALEFEPSESATRLSFGISYWGELARRYPKAKQALLEIRDRGVGEFEKGGGYFDLFQEILAINRELNDADATLALFKSIDARDRQLARQCYFGVEDLLVERGEYALCARYIGNFQQRFLNARDVRTRLSAILDRSAGIDRSKMNRDGNESFIKDCRKLVEILVGLERKAEAVAIRDMAVAVLNVPELSSAVEDAELRTAKFRQSPQKEAAVASSPLEFRLIADDADSTSPVDELTERQRDGSEIKHRVLRTVMLDGSAVARAGFETEPTGTVSISVGLSPEGARQFSAITATNMDRRLAIVSAGKVLSAPLIKTTITGGELRISGSFSTNEARRLVAALNRQLDANATTNPAVANDSVADARIRLALEQLDAARQLFESGRIGRKEFLEAEHRLSVAEAHGDAVAIARANLTFANAALAIGKQHFEAGVLSAPEYKILQNQQVIAELELKEAQKTKEAAAK